LGNTVLYRAAAVSIPNYQPSDPQAEWQKLSDALTSGIGNLVDADMAKESAKLQSLQVKQQLGAQALSIANQSPQIILSLFKGA